jgi:hypothetical protein
MRIFKKAPLRRGLAAVVVGLLVIGCASSGVLSEKQAEQAEKKAEKEAKKAEKKARKARRHWQARHGQDTDQLRRDIYRCAQESRTFSWGGGSGLIGLGMVIHSQVSAKSQADKLYDLCMEAAGWDLVPVKRR